ncbi:MAG TPA: hypothetical protein VK249_07810 [Anaerolineales bacterium]|nr:hypothetical protein [Anaerolineales bacterium]
MQKLIRQILPLAARIGADPQDSDDVQLRKTLLVLGACMFIVAGALWGSLYFSFGEWIAGCIPLGYALISSLSVRSKAQFSDRH